MGTRKEKPKKNIQRCSNLLMITLKLKKYLKKLSKIVACNNKCFWSA